MNSTLSVLRVALGTLRGNGQHRRPKGRKSVKTHPNEFLPPLPKDIDFIKRTRRNIREADTAARALLNLPSPIPCLKCVTERACTRLDGCIQSRSYLI